MTDEKEPKIQQNESASATEDDEIIELTDKITTSLENNEEIIDLKDVVADVGSTINKADLGPDIAVEQIFVTDDTSSEVSAEAAPFSEPSEVQTYDEIKISNEMDEEFDFVDDSQDDFVESLGMDLETDSAINEFQKEFDTSTKPEQKRSDNFSTDSISPDQVEAAIERVIMKILPDKIESILATAIEKTLSREIDKLKSMLAEDSTEDRDP